MSSVVGIRRINLTKGVLDAANWLFFIKEENPGIYKEVKNKFFNRELAISKEALGVMNGENYTNLKGEIRIKIWVGMALVVQILEQALPKEINEYIAALDAIVDPESINWGGFIDKEAKIQEMADFLVELYYGKK